MVVIMIRVTRTVVVGEIGREAKRQVLNKHKRSTLSDRNSPRILKIYSG